MVCNDIHKAWKAHCLASVFIIIKCVCVCCGDHTVTPTDTSSEATLCTTTVCLLFETVSDLK